MRFRRKKRSEAAGWVLAAGVVLTGVAAAFAVSRILKAGPVARLRELRHLEKTVLRALLKDDVAKSQAIDISAVGSGVVELSGVVDTAEDARHIIELVDDIPGITAVLNRFEIRSVESKLQQNRAKAETRDGARWYGGKVGMGRRRQSPATDPQRRDDHVDLLTRSQLPNRDDTLTAVEEAEGTGVRIGLSHTGAFTTDVPPASPNAATDRPGRPPEAAPHDAARRE